MAFLDKIKAGLSKTKASLGTSLDGLFSGFHKADEEFFEELEETLILADLGVSTAVRVVEQLRNKVKEDRISGEEPLRAVLGEILVDILRTGELEMNLSTRPSVILVIGVNGTGKTTTIGKLSAKLSAEGKKVLLCAADTFRAAAAGQLEIWAQRTGADLIRQNEGADPASVVYDALGAAKARGSDVIICDTAGRLHNKQNLMNELNKIDRIISRELPNAARETLLVLDAATGQNGLVQAGKFSEAAQISGIVLTKLDGTAKGGIVVAVCDKLKIPVKWIGVGEKVVDLLPFSPEDFIEALLS
jgi:fused signal recognition particle receptor